MSAPVSTVPGVNGARRQLYQFELESEVRGWLDSLSDFDYKRVDEVCGMLADKGTGLGGLWSDHASGASRPPSKCLKSGVAAGDDLGAVRGAAARAFAARGPGGGAAGRMIRV